MNIVQIDFGLDDDGGADPKALLDRYPALTGWSEALAAAGARVTVVQRFHRNATVARNGVDYIFCASTRHLHRVAVRTVPDVVHVNGLIFPLETWVLRRLLPARTPIVVQDHGTDEPDLHRTPSLRFLHQAVRRRAFRAADGFLFVADRQAEAWRRTGFIASSHHVYEVTEASTTFRSVRRSDARQMSGMDGMPALLWVGRLNSNKDPLTTLDGFELALASLPAAVLTMIYSEADLLPAVRKRLSASPVLEKHVRLVGRVPHHRLPAFYSAADLFVLGSHHEGSGYALIEACACGAVPVVTDIPAFRAITADGSLGALWTPGNARSLAGAIVDVAQRDLGALRGRIAEHFDRTLSWPAIGRRALAAYRDVMTRRLAALSGHSSG